MRNKDKKLALIGCLFVSLMFVSLFSPEMSCVSFTKPGEFELNDDTGSIERDGKVRLDWTVSKFAESYKLYVSDSEITNQNSADLVKQFTYKDLSHVLTFDENSNGTYYYVLVANNELGSTMSNNIYFEVSVPPIPLEFTLKTSLEYTTDGNFELNWTNSKYTKQYDVYRSESEDFSNSRRIKAGLTDTNYTLNWHQNGTYYYKIVAHNPHGSIESNKVKVVVDLKKPTLDLTWISDYWLDLVLILVIILLLFVYFIWRSYEYPVLLVLSEDKYEEKKLGRFIDEYKSKYIPGYWILVFKNGKKGIKKYYSKYNRKTLEQFILGSKYGFEKYSAEIILRKVKVKDLTWIRIPRIKRVKWSESKMNGFIYVLYRIVNRLIPNKKISRGFHNLVKYEDTGEFKETIDVLQLRLVMKRITTVFDVKYKERIVDESGEKIKDFERKAVPVHFINDLQRSKSVVKNSIQKSNKREITTIIHDIEEAVNENKSIDELRSIHDLEMSYQIDKYNRLTNKYTKLSDMYRQLKADQKIKLSEQIKQITEESTIDDDDLAQIISRVLELKRDGVDVSTTIREAYHEYLDKKDNRKHGGLITENEKLKKELELTKAERDRLWANESQRENRKNNKIIIEDNLEQ